MPNRLANESSPYLLQHQANPVDWHPWGPEAIGRARDEDKPIFLSIGYSACHWCHVMERESFEDEDIARVLNANFISIKVDREERPDLDQIYMNAVQMLTGRGGWPMSVFLTPDLRPFYGGTYWPPQPSRGMPGFGEILAAVDDAWRNRRGQALEAAGQITEEIRKVGLGLRATDEAKLSPGLLQAAYVQLGRAFDPTYGGFGQAPKFPHPMDLRLLLRGWQRTGRRQLLEMVETTLDRMAAGGIYDHLGGGFARYSVDDRWLVPHFEKMLYDNALLSLAYVEAYQITRKDVYATVVRQTLDYVLRDMTDPKGGFYSAEDADSEGVEGKFYTWTTEEIHECLGEARGSDFCRVFDVSEEGNYEGRNILNLPKTISQYSALLQRDPDELAQQLSEDRTRLFQEREQRVRPSRDDKVLVAWNGLMIDALAQAGPVLGESRYTEAATRAVSFILSDMRRDDGRLLHTWRAGKAKIDAYLDDYACLLNAMVSVYEATFNAELIEQAVSLADIVVQKFSDPDGGGFFFTADDQEQLIARNKDATDASVPSGNGMLALALLRLGTLTHRRTYLEAAESTLVAAQALMQRIPMATGQLMLALDFHLGPTYELVVNDSFAKPDAQQERDTLWRRFLPSRTIACGEPGGPAATGVTRPSPGSDTNQPAHPPTLHVCHQHVCGAPVTGVDAIEQTLAQLNWESASEAADS